MPLDSLFIVLSKDSQLVDDGLCAVGERSLVGVVGGVVKYEKNAVRDMRLSGGVTLTILPEVRGGYGL